MVFVTMTQKEEAQYAYICTQLKRTVNGMCTGRKTLEAMANASFDKPFAKCMYMLTSELLQCENEIRSHIDSLICKDYEDEHHTENKKLIPVHNLNSVNSVCRFFEETYLRPYKKLLKDKHFDTSLKMLIQNHLQQLNWSLTQLRLFNDVQTSMN